MTRTLYLTLVILLAVAVVGAQEDAAAPEKPAEDVVENSAPGFLAGLEGLDETLCGVFTFEIRFRGQAIGAAKLTVAAAEEGTGAVYRVDFDAKMAAGAESFEGKETTWLDEKLALVRSDVRRTETRATGTVVKVTRLRREAGGWVFTREIGDELLTLRQEYPGLVHGGTAAELLLIRKIAGSEPGTFVLKGIDWPEPEDGPEKVPAVKDLVVTTEKVPEIHMSGEAVPTLRLTVARVNGNVTEYDVSTAGAVGRFSPQGSPVEFVSDEFSLPPDPGADTPADAVVTYLRVLSGGKPVSALDSVMDWAALSEWLNPGASTSLVAFASALKAQFASKVGVLSDAQVAAVAPLLAVTVEGDKATVALPGQDANPFELVKKPDGWRIVRFPR